MRNAIAVGVSDLTDSRAALRWAMELAGRSTEAVVLVHVLDDDGGSSGGPGRDRTMIDEARLLSPTTEVRSRILRGSVTWELVAASDDYDLIVVGTHKTGFIHGSIYGSANLSLAASAACPVIVVPEALSADPEGVLVGADESAAGLAALVFAAAEAAAVGQPLTILRVSAPGEADRGADRSADRMLSRLRATAGAAHPSLAVETRHVRGATAGVLVAASSSTRMLVLGDSRTGSTAPPTLGAVCHDALVNIRVPTAIVHGADSHDPRPEVQRAAWMRSVRAARAGVGAAR